MRIYADLDGTLCDTPEGVDHDSADDLLAKCKPKARALQHLLDAHSLGHDVGIVTARGHHVQHPTFQQLRAWLGDLGDVIPVYFRRRLIFDWTHYVPDKEHHLRRQRVDVYVGDRPEDRAAALRAGARFLWAHEFEQYGLTALREVTA